MTHLGDGDDPSMVVQIDPNQRHEGQRVTVENRFDTTVQLRRHNPNSRRRSMRPRKKSTATVQRKKLRKRRK